MPEYKGLQIRCAPGVHEAVVRLASERIRKNGRILDLASGSGALASRLLDAGFSSVTPVDRDIEAYRLTSLPLRNLDLDRAFASELKGPFDAIMAVEIIEHLSSPVRFLEQCRGLLGQKGVIIVSTPNVCEWRSRLKFIVRGELRYFDDKQYNHQRHISPLIPNLAPFIFREAGFRIVATETAGNFGGKLGRYVYSGIGGTLNAFGGGGLWAGECVIFTAEAV